VWIREEEREDHLHILGTTGEGKSKFIEYLIREDIKRGHGVCFLDPTDRADTAYNILRWCCKEGFEKVCLIDPHTITRFNKLTAVQPFNYRYESATVANLEDTIKTVFQIKDTTETPRIQYYLPAMLHVLWNAGLTLHEAVYFTKYKEFIGQRKQILSCSPAMDLNRLTIDEVFQTYPRFNNEFASSVRRLAPFFGSDLDLMLSPKEAVDFPKMITDGWVILVNLYAGLGFRMVHSRMLGTVIINEIIFALDRLRQKGWKGTYYLYVDEAGQYANRNLAQLLAYKRKSGLRVTVAHQYFKQFEDLHVLDAVKNLCKNKVMFNTPNPTDRLEMVKLLGYGGAIPRLEAEYVNKDIPKQYAVIKKGKTEPLRIRIPDVKTPDPKGFKDYIGSLLNNEWNFIPAQVHAQIQQRLNDLLSATQPNTRRPRAGTKTKRTTDSPPDTPPRRSVFSKS